VLFLIVNSYLTSVEERLNNLEALVAKLLPGLDIDEALLSSSGNAPAFVQFDPRTPSESSTVSPPTIERIHDKISEAVPDEADGFEWQEKAPSIDDLTDGMAALSIEPNGTGYLGKVLVNHRHCQSVQQYSQVPRQAYSSSALFSLGLGI